MLPQILLGGKGEKVGELQIPQRGNCSRQSLLSHYSAPGFAEEEEERHGRAKQYMAYMGAHRSPSLPLLEESMAFGSYMNHAC